MPLLHPPHSQHAPSTKSPVLPKRTLQPPTIPQTGLPGAFLLELMIFSGHPFKDHWVYWVNSHSRPDLGVMIHVAGDVRNGFAFQVKRGYDCRNTQSSPMKRVPLQWVDGRWFDEGRIFNDGIYKLDDRPVCGFEKSVFKATDQLVQDGIFNKEVADYLRAIQQ